MKTLAILLATVLAAGSLTGCATEPETTDSVLHPGRKPLLETPTSQTGTRDQRIDDGRVTSVEIFETDDSTITKVHHLDAETGIDTISVLDENDVVVRIETRYEATELVVAGRR